MLFEREDLIDCYRTRELCNGVRSVMTVKQCCLGDGIAYQREGHEGCHICVGKFRIPKLKSIEYWKPCSDNSYNN